MATTYTPDSLRTLFQSSFNLAQWYGFLQHFFNASELKEKPERIIENTSDEGYYLGNIDTTDSYRIGLFQYNITKGSVANKRVGLRNLVKSFINPTWGEFDAALVVFDSGDHWRLSFICDIKGESTSPKRYTYVFGSDDLLYRTPIERFNFLKKKGISFENMKTAFSVEALSDEFFDKYREQYADFIQYITGKRFVKVGSKWEEKILGEPNAELMQAFDHNEKKIRDYVKKMMGRITFLHFLQRKGWMCGDLNFMQNLFERSFYKNNYLDAVLEPLFFGILNTKPAEREALFTDYGWDKSLLSEWKDIPYLNGGLFERDEEDEPESRFPADYFKRLFQFFSEYNFTIDENDPNDAEVGVDPEMLGKIFENLLEDNKDKGAFYTPKEIVRYMCQESLIAYLETNTSIAKEKVRQFVLSPEEGISGISEKWKGTLMKALEEVKICDPAIGSGAFPMSLLNELLHCREVLSGEHYNRAEIKKSIIQNNIYGVDIEKGAVDIARLRFWLSIVVDEETPSPLPNLDYKIMQGNSLIESFEGVDLSKLTYEKEYKKDKGEITLFDDEKNRLQKTVSLLLASYYSCSDHDKKVRLRQEISNTINKQLEAQAYNPAILKKLKAINLAENNQFFLWHTWFSDVFNREDKEGFDIVIGNPPYVKIQNMDSNEASMLKKNYITATGKFDLYVPFVEFAFKLMHKQGVSVYIHPHRVLNVGYAKTLRNFIKEKKGLNKLLHFGVNQVFDAATTYSGIFIYQNNSQCVQYASVKNSELESIQYENFSWDMIGESWNFDFPKNNTILEKIKLSPIKLSDIFEGIYQGLITLGDDMFMMEGFVRDNLFVGYSKVLQREVLLESEVMKPILKGENIRRYKNPQNTLYVIYPHVMNEKGKTVPIEENEFKRLYPKTYEYLLFFKEELVSKKIKYKTNPKYWYSLHRPREIKLFNTVKILTPQLQNNSNFTIDYKYMYPDAGGYMLIPKEQYSELILYYLSIFNSKLFYYFIKNTSTAFNNDYYYFKTAYIEPFNFCNSTAQEQEKLIHLVENIKNALKQNVKADISAYERLIDNIIYSLYGLTDTEIKIIEQSV